LDLFWNWLPVEFLVLPSFQESPEASHSHHWLQLDQFLSTECPGKICQDWLGSAEDLLPSFQDIMHKEHDPPKYQYQFVISGWKTFSGVAGGFHGDKF
jgi:hypothetical protein